MAKRKRLNLSVLGRRNISVGLVVLVLLLIVELSSQATDFSLADGLTSVPTALLWMVTHLVPTAKSLTNLPDILSALGQTILMAVAATVLGAICALFFSLMGARTTSPSVILTRAARVVASFFRNIPDVVWTIILLFSFGQNMITGIITLFFTSFGMLTRYFIEVIDEIGSDTMEALRSTGANYFQTFAQGIYPSIIPEVVVWTMFMVETNIRDATLIGILTATGIGYVFSLFYTRLDFATCGLIIVALAVVIITLELVSSQIKKMIV
ncbi:MAG: ABC transporter permease subunit [Propionibacteriaceae bacterium]|nr:ABC transporter permease subunit [Propionibacteriaceae bacterium]